MPSTALDYITIQGFKSIASVEKLALRPINVVIGPNGSGKSNFIGAFSYLPAIREGRLRDYVTAAEFGAAAPGQPGPLHRLERRSAAAQHSLDRI